MASVLLHESCTRDMHKGAWQAWARNVGPGACVCRWVSSTVRPGSWAAARQTVASVLLLPSSWIGWHRGTVQDAGRTAGQLRRSAAFRQAKRRSPPLVRFQRLALPRPCTHLPAKQHAYAHQLKGEAGEQGGFDAPAGAHHARREVGDHARQLSREKRGEGRGQARSAGGRRRSSARLIKGAAVPGRGCAVPATEQLKTVLGKWPFVPRKRRT